MSDDLTWAIAEALLRQHGTECNCDYLTWEDFIGEADDLAAALAPLIEARVREARAKAAADAYADIMRTAADASMACRRVAEGERKGADQ